ncbi:hypothetical protein Acr_00g0063810 [Actinidia rufa]|uniref:Uncharacterized protein n=1 Tax=Actinidia rufa TaxID=165716 RepID=A0A7J0DPC6_9ERIC|nr:hypothetical protein Acr_00g0063810 [Actinidia rufa]
MERYSQYFQVGNYCLERTELLVKWQRMRLKFGKMLLMMQLINPIIKNHLLAPMIATFLSIQMGVAYEHRLSERRQGVFAELEKLNLEIEDMLTTNAMILATEVKIFGAVF